MAIRSSREFLLGLLFAPGPSGKQAEAITGITRIEKISFLGRRRPALKAVCEDMEFEPDNFGPYSAKLKDDLEYLKDLGLVQEEAAGGSYPTYDDLGSGQEDSTLTPVRYQLTPKGTAIAKQLWAKFAEEERRELHSLKEEYNSWNLDQLVRFVYQTSEPLWISKSRIADRYTQ